MFRTLLALVCLSSVAAHAELMDANTASRDELMVSEAVDAAVADAIIGGRPYLSAAELDAKLADVVDTEARQALYASVFRQMDLNAAGEDEIMLILGMSKKMAHEFEEYRPYKSMTQFRREIGKYVDDAEVARLEQYVFIPMNLNTASEDDIMKIPGMSKKMAHEFEEYRPYKSMAQFRREIGKYVDADEVARLESYVTLD